MIRLAAACLAAAVAGTAYAVIRHLNARPVEHNAVTGTGEQ
ncbi:hypothetical protein [Gordonia caeni]|uniref:Uncharacterized protein n=1 Tax=Gordonia caeni TaxID=1007097 RepID=A0ABP7PDY6_9ACTN